MNKTIDIASNHMCSRIGRFIFNDLPSSIFSATLWLLYAPSLRKMIVMSFILIYTLMGNSGCTRDTWLYVQNQRTEDVLFVCWQVKPDNVMYKYKISAESTVKIRMLSPDFCGFSVVGCKSGETLSKPYGELAIDRKGMMKRHYQHEDFIIKFIITSNDIVVWAPPEPFWMKEVIPDIQPGFVYVYGSTK